MPTQEQVERFRRAFHAQLATIPCDHEVKLGILQWFS
jgi:hypothetical protein